MTDALMPCGSCDRHLRASSSTCPFCGAAREPVEVAPRPPTPRASRAVLFALGASMSLAGCGETGVPVYGAPAPPDVANDAAGDAAGDAPADMVDVPLTDVPVYGAPPDVPRPDAGDAAADADDASFDATPADNGGVRYGAPPPPDWC